MIPEDIIKNKKGKSQDASSLMIDETLDYVTVNFPQLHFIKHQDLSHANSNSELEGSILVDLLDVKNKLIISCETTISERIKDQLKSDGYQLLDITTEGHGIEELDIFLNEHREFIEAARLVIESRKGEANRETEPENEYDKTSETDEGSGLTSFSSVETHSISVQNSEDEDGHEVTDLIERTPGWLLRSGTSIIFFVTVMVLVMGNFIQYPDKINAKATITTPNPPIAHMTKSSGIIETVAVANGEYVKKDDELIYLKNPASRNDISLLIQFIEAYESSDKLSFVKHEEIPYDLDLGELQSSYAILNLKLLEFRQVLLNRNVFDQLSTISKEIERIYELIDIQNTENSLFKEELDLSNKDVQRNRKLHEQGVISDVDNEQFSMREIQMKRQYQGMQNGVIQNQIRIEQLRLQMSNLKEQRQNTLEQYQFQINEIISSIKETHQRWKDQYIIYAEKSGVFSYSFGLKEGFTVPPGHLVGYVVVENENIPKILTSIVKAAGISELQKGNKAIIKIDAYPAIEYGVVVAEISSISALPIIAKGEDDLYEILVNLPSQLTTDYGEKISSTPNMGATVDFITKDKTLLARVLHQFLELINY